MCSQVRQHNYSHALLGQIYEAANSAQMFGGDFSVLAWLDFAQQHSLNIDQSMWGVELSTFDTYDTRNSFEALSANFGNLMSISQVDSLSYSGRED